jgi:hypothetical protein
MDIPLLFNISSDVVSEIFSYISMEDICIVLHWSNKALYKHTKTTLFWCTYFNKKTQLQYHRLLADFSSLASEFGSDVNLFMRLCGIKFQGKIQDRFIWHEAWYNAMINNKPKLEKAIENNQMMYNFIKSSPHYYIDIKRDALAIRYYKIGDATSLKMGSKKIIKSKIGYACSTKFAYSVGIIISPPDIALAAARAENLTLLKDVFLLYGGIRLMNLDKNHHFNYNSDIAKYLIEEQGKTIDDYEDEIHECMQITSEYHLLQYFHKHMALILGGTLDDEKKKFEVYVLWSMLSTCINHIDPDVHAELVKELHQIDSNKEEIEYIYRYCMEHGHDYLAHKMKLLEPDIKEERDEDDNSEELSD